MEAVYFVINGSILLMIQLLYNKKREQWLNYENAYFR